MNRAGCGVGSPNHSRGMFYAGISACDTTRRRLRANNATPPSLPQVSLSANRTAGGYGETGARYTPSFSDDRWKYRPTAATDHPSPFLPRDATLDLLDTSDFVATSWNPARRPWVPGEAGWVGCPGAPAETCRSTPDEEHSATSSCRPPSFRRARRAPPYGRSNSVLGYRPPRLRLAFLLRGQSRRPRIRCPCSCSAIQDAVRRRPYGSCDHQRMNALPPVAILVVSWAASPRPPHGSQGEVFAAHSTRTRTAGVRWHVRPARRADGARRASASRSQSLDLLRIRDPRPFLPSIPPPAGVQPEPPSSGTEPYAPRT